MNSNVIDDIEEERSRQEKKWGGSTHDDQHRHEDWLRVMIRQIGDADRAVECNDGDYYRKQLVQIAALAVAALDSPDRQSGE